MSHPNAEAPHLFLTRFFPGFHSSEGSSRLADYTTTPRVIPISLLAVGIGVVCAYVAVGLLKLIGLFTNLFFYHRWDTSMASPAANHLGVWVIGVPILGALIVGIMGRYGSERIRGHGLPEAIEAILLWGARRAEGGVVQAHLGRHRFDIGVIAQAFLAPERCQELQ